MINLNLKIDAVYNSEVAQAEEFNIYYNLLVTFNDYKIIINYKKFEYFNNDLSMQKNINEGKIILNNVKDCEYNLIESNIVNNDLNNIKFIKELIFYKFLDFFNHDLKFDFIE